jgi:hypothetical protein
MSLQDGDFDVDSYLKDLDTPTPERAESNPPEIPDSSEQPVGRTPTTVQPTTPVQEYEFDWQGRKIKAPVDKLTKWASQGYDYSQKMEAFKKQQADFAEQRKVYDKYKTIDDYVKKDPKWWEHVEKQYQEKHISDDPTFQRFNAIVDEKLAPYENFLAQKQQQEEQAKIQSEDTALASEIKSIREKYSDLDFDLADAEGKSLEYKVLKHGAENGFPSFRSAFLDFYHDQLEKRWESRGKETLAKDVEKRKKLGLSETPTPTPRKVATDSFDVRGRSYNELEKEIFERLGLT